MALRQFLGSKVIPIFHSTIPLHRFLTANTNQEVGQASYPGLFTPVFFFLLAVLTLVLQATNTWGEKSWVRG